MDESRRCCSVMITSFARRRHWQRRVHDLLDRGEALLDRASIRRRRGCAALGRGRGDLVQRFLHSRNPRRDSAASRAHASRDKRQHKRRARADAASAVGALA